MNKPETFDESIERIKTETEMALDHAVRTLHPTGLLEKINVDYTPIHAHDRYSSRDDDRFSFCAIIKLFIYKELKRLTQEETVQRVNKQAFIRTRLGLDSKISQGSISHTWRNRFTKSLRSAIVEIADEIRTQYEQSDVNIPSLSSITPNVNELTDKNNTPSIENYVDQHAPKIISSTVETAMQGFDTKRADHAVHDDADIMNQQLVMSVQDRSGTRAAYRSKNKSFDRPVHNDTHVRAIKSLGSPTGQLSLDDFGNSSGSTWRLVNDVIQDQWQNSLSYLLDSIVPDLTADDEVAVAIDTTFIPYFACPWKDKEDIESDDPVIKTTRSGRKLVPREDYPSLVRKAPKQFNKKAKNKYEYYFEIATLTIVGNGVPYILAWEPVKSESEWEIDGESQPRAEVVDRLLDNAREHVDIGLVMADRAFEANSVEHVIAEKHGLDYLMPLKADSSNAKEWYAAARGADDVSARVKANVPVEINSSTPYVDQSDEKIGTDANSQESHIQTIAFVPAEKDSWALVEANDADEKLTGFVTNRDIGPLIATDLSQNYHDRWQIENEYRMILPFLPSIASTDVRMRLFSFGFGMLLYNIWRAVDHGIKVLVAERFDRSLSELLNENPLLPKSDMTLTSVLFFVFKVT